MKPILFNTKMVQAIMDGKKTVTRRVVKFLDGKNPNWTGYVKDGLMLYNGTNEPCCRNAPYKQGDVLYVRETWYRGLNRIMYKANYSENEKFYQDGKEILIKWKPSIHMPKEVARIFLKVTDVRVERLQNMHCEDAMKEGIDPRLCVNLAHTVTKFKKLWNSTIKKEEIDTYGWDANPWVWVIEFERCDKPIE